MDANPNDTAMLAFVGELVLIIGAAGSAILGFSKLNTKIALVAQKVDIMWARGNRRAYTEASEDGLGSFNSPFEISKLGREEIQKFESEISTLITTFQPKITDHDVFIEIEKAFSMKFIEQFGSKKEPAYLAIAFEYTLELMNRRKE